MAEFKLSRIRFNWKGEWTGGTDYIVDDMINYNGYTYVELRTHTSADFYNDLAGTDLTPAKPKWKKQSEGVVWLGNWSTSTFYSVGGIVKYGASIYQCTEAHTSSATLTSGTDGLVADINKSPIEMLGHVTSSYYSPNLKKSIALGVVRGGKNMIGQKLIIPMENKKINVTVADPVFLDKENKRLNA